MAHGGKKRNTDGKYGKNFINAVGQLDGLQIITHK
jgi:hypothetical protein